MSDPRRRLRRASYARVLKFSQQGTAELEAATAGALILSDMSPKGFTMACRSAVCAVIAIVAASQAIVAPVIIQANDTVGTGKTRISWTPSAGAAGYLVSAEPFSFSESFPRGSMTPGAWECAGPSCPNGVTTWSASTYPGNITLTMNGFANNCRSYLADCPSAEARLLHTAVFSVKSAFSISAFVDMSVGNNGIFQNNTAAGTWSAVKLGPLPRPLPCFCL